MKVKIKRYTAVAAWRWNGVDFDDLCGICRRQFDATCPECKYPGEQCPLAFGTCGHAFHNHCLNQWLGGMNANNEPNTKCPMCRAKFVRRPAKGEQQQETVESRMSPTNSSDSASPETEGNQGDGNQREDTPQLSPD